MTLNTGPTPQEAHVFLPTITGLCLRCRKPQSDHGVLVQKVEDAVHQCAVVHDSVNVQRISGMGGESWSHCPMCDAIIEPKLATGEPTGPAWGRGRGDLTERLKKYLDWVAWLDAR